MDRIQETAILHQLKSEFDTNLVEADRKIYMRDFIIKASERLIELVDNPSLIEENIHLDSLIIYTRLNPTFNKRPGVTAELLNSGKLYLISNPEIRRLISEWAVIVEELNEEENLLTEIVSTATLHSLLSILQREIQIVNLVKTSSKEAGSPSKVDKG